MTFARRRNRLTAHFSERYTVVKQRISVQNVTHHYTTRWHKIGRHTMFNRKAVLNDLFCHPVYKDKKLRFCILFSTHAYCPKHRVFQSISSSIFFFFFVLWRCDPTRVMVSSFLRFLDHTQRRTTVGRTPLDK
jgi:hypothetical protein